MMKGELDAMSADVAAQKEDEVETEQVWEVEEPAFDEEEQRTRRRNSRSWSKMMNGSRWRWLK